MAAVYNTTADAGYLMTLCATLGNFVEDENGVSEYVKHEDCLETLQDIMRFLHRDDPDTREIFLLLGKWNLVKNDLLPIIRTYYEDTPLLIAATKLVVFLTLPVDPKSSSVVEQQHMLQRAKAAFLHGQTSAVMVSLVAEPLARREEQGARGMEQQDARLVQLILTLFRNLLCVPDIEASRASGGDHMTSLKDELLQRFFAENVMELLLLIAQDADKAPFTEDAALLLEIVFEILKGHAPGDMASLCTKGEGGHAVETEEEETLSGIEKENDPQFQTQKGGKRGDTSVLAALLEEEKSKKPSAKMIPSRHSRFVGCYIRPHKNGDGAQTVVKGNNPLVSDTALAWQARQGKVKTQYTRAAFGRSKPRLMTTNRLLAEEKEAATKRPTRKAIVGFLEQFIDGPYNKLMGQIAADIAAERSRGLSDEELKLRMQHFLQVGRFCLSYMRHANKFESSSETQEGAFKESPFACVCETVDQRTFHFVRREWAAFVSQKNFHAQGMALAMLKEMLFVLEVAQRAGTDMDARVAHQLALSVLADETDEGLLRMMSGCLRSFVPNKQPRSHLLHVVQGVDVVLKLLDMLDRKHNGNLLVKQKQRQRAKKKTKGAAPATAAANGSEGNNEEGSEGNTGENAGGGEENADVNERGEENVPEEEDGEGMNAAEAEEEEDEEDNEPREQERTLDLQQVFMKLLDPQMVNNYFWLLKDYYANGKVVTDCLVAFLKRICTNSMEPMLYQLSVMSVIHSLLSDPCAKKEAELSPLIDFCSDLVRKFLSALVPLEPPTQDDSAEDPNEALTRRGRRAAADMMFCEVLFWKHRPHAIAIQQDLDYDAALGPMPVNERGARGLARGRTAGGGRHGRSLPFSDMDDEELVLLFAEFEADNECVAKICDGLDFRFTENQVKRRMLQLGLSKRRGAFGFGGAGGSRGTGSGSARTHTARRPPRAGASRLFEEGSEGEHISESEDEDEDEDEDRHQMQDERTLNPAREPSAHEDARRSLEEERTERRTTRNTHNTTDISDVVSKIVQEEGGTAASSKLSWVCSKVTSALALWRAMTAQRTSLDDFSIVPTEDEDWDMLEDNKVERLLELLGVRGPCHGHMFWRVPGDWGVEGLEEAARTLNQAAKGHNLDVEILEVTEGGVEDQTGGANVESAIYEDDESIHPEKDDARESSPRGDGQQADTGNSAMASDSHLRQAVESEDEDEELDDTRSRKRNVVASSDDEDMDGYNETLPLPDVFADSTLEGDAEHQEGGSAPKKRRVAMQSDSDDEI